MFLRKNKCWNNFTFKFHSNRPPIRHNTSIDHRVISWFRSNIDFIIIFTNQISEIGAFPSFSVSFSKGMDSSYGPIMNEYGGPIRGFARCRPITLARDWSPQWRMSPWREDSISSEDTTFKMIYNRICKTRYCLQCMYQTQK